MPKPSSRRGKRPPKRQTIEVPGFQATFNFDVATIHAKTGHTDDGATLGACVFHANDRVIAVTLNVAHGGIRSAAYAHDNEMLTSYVATACHLGITEMTDKQGDWPWPHDNWPEFMMALDHLASKARDLGKIQ